MTPPATTRSRRPRATLTQDAVVTGAIALADADGLPAVTMSRLAASLGVTTMALYWHFRDKDELLAAMGGRLFAETELGPLTDEPWDVQVHATLRSLVASLDRHPAVAALAMSTVLVSEPGLVLAERVLALLRSGGFPREDAAQLGVFLLGSVVALVTTEPGPDANLPTETQEERTRQKRASLQVLSPERFPTLIELADSLIDCSDQSAYLDRGIALLVGGLRTLTSAMTA